MEVVKSLAFQVVRVRVLAIVATQAENRVRSRHFVTKDDGEISWVRNCLPYFDDKLVSRGCRNVKGPLMMTISHGHDATRPAEAGRDILWLVRERAYFGIFYADGCHGRRAVDFSMATRHTPSVVPRKPRHPEPSAKNEQGEYATFVKALRLSYLYRIPHQKPSGMRWRGSRSRNLPLLTRAIRFDFPVSARATSNLREGIPD